MGKVDFGPYASLHAMGMAQEYEVRGRGNVHSVNGYTDGLGWGRR